MNEPTVTITSPGGELAAEFVPGANLLCSSLRHRGTELLDLGRGVEAYARQGKTMGIPLLYPWANRLSSPGYTAAGETVTLPDDDPPVFGRDPNGLPIHGALPHLIAWEVQTCEGARLRARTAWDDPTLLTLFPFCHTVEVEAVLADHGLSLTTTVHADQGDAVPVAFGYHPYLTLGTDRRDWRVELGASQQLVLDEQMIPTGAREPLAERDLRLGERSFDDGLAGLSTPAQFLVCDASRSLRVSFETGYDWAQVYAPPGHDYICFEPMTAPTNALSSGEGLTVIAPGESYAASFQLTVTP